jgi:hypothetical protein
MGIMSFTLRIVSIKLINIFKGTQTQYLELGKTLMNGSYCYN